MDHDVIHIVGEVKIDGEVGVAHAVGIVALDELIRGLGRETLRRQRGCGIPGQTVSFVDEEVVFDHVVFVLVPAPMLRRETAVERLAEIVNAPVKAVEPEMHISAVRRDLAEIAHRIAHPLVADVGGATGLPAGRCVHDRIRVAGASAQDERVEVVHAGIGQKREVKFARAETVAETDPQGMLQGRRVVATGVAVNAQAGFCLEARRAVGEDQLDAGFAFPVVALLIRAGVNAARGTEEIIPRRDEAQGRQGKQCRGDVVTGQGVSHDLRIHLVVRGVTVPRSWEARRIRRLARRGGREDKGMRIDIRRRVACQEGGRAQRGGVRDDE